jgi:hypothetical protein
MSLSAIKDATNVSSRRRAERIEAAVETALERQIATTIAFSAIASTRSQQGPCQRHVRRAAA